MRSRPPSPSAYGVLADMALTAVAVVGLVESLDQQLAGVLLHGGMVAHVAAASGTVCRDVWQP